MRELAASKKRGEKKTAKERRFAPIKKIRSGGGKKRNRFVRLPDNRLGRFLDRLLFAVPRYLKGAWQELRLTTWPGRRETIRLTFAVFVFSAIFAVFIAGLDFVLDKLFKQIIIK